MPDLGKFSVSLTVQDIAASRTFYESLGFEQIAGKQEQGWVILQSGNAVIGLFHGMFESNILTFNPTDVRAIKAHLEAQGTTVELRHEMGDSSNPEEGAPAPETGRPTSRSTTRTAIPSSSTSGRRRRQQEEKRPRRLPGASSSRLIPARCAL